MEKGSIEKQAKNMSNIFMRAMRLIPTDSEIGPMWSLKRIQFLRDWPSNWLLATGILIRNTPLVPSGTVADYDYYYIHQTELAMRGSNGVGLEGAMKSLRECSLTRPPIFAAIYGTW